MHLPAPIAALPARREAMTSLLIHWAEINSGSGNEAGLRRMCQALQEEFAQLPGTPSVETIPLPGHFAPALRVRSHRTSRPEATVLLSGHFDTVYDAAHPFQRCERLSADTLRGPGVADMKGGIVVMLEALRAFESTPGAARLGWGVLLTPDEETGSAASAAAIAAAAHGHRLALIFEPARPNGNLVRARMGTGVFVATCHGRAAHAGRDPAEGRNAILALCEYLPRANESIASMPGVLINVGAVRGGGAVNIVPDLASADMNIRISNREHEALIRERLAGAAAPISAREGYRLEITGKFNRPPKQVSAEETAFFERWRACASAVGITFDWQDVGGGSDGNLLAAAGLPCLDGLGVVGDGLHSPVESIDLRSLPQRAQIAALFLTGWSALGATRS